MNEGLVSEASMAGIRRRIFLSAFFSLFSWDTPRSSLALLPQEEALADLFETNTRGVANVIDITLLNVVRRQNVAEEAEGNGSGCVWDDEGHIVTNYHVLGGAIAAKKISGAAQVILLGEDGEPRTFSATLVGADKRKDVAVLRVDAPKSFLRPLARGDSTRLRVGQQVLAIGNPFGFDHTLTTGVISGLNREIQSQPGSSIGGGIQTDAAINPGKSSQKQGVPLVQSSQQLAVHLTFCNQDFQARSQVKHVPFIDLW